MKNNTMIPYNPKKDLETNYYNKTEVELLVAGGSGGSINLSDYYKKIETYSKAQVDALVAGGGADLSDYYTKAEVESLISAIPATDLTNYYNKTQVDSLIPNISTKQDTLVSATNIKTINGESVLGSGNIEITGGGAVDLSDYYKKTETYSKVEVDTKIADIPTTDLSGYYKKTETYSKVETNSLVATKQDVLVSGTNIKTINGESVLGSGNIVIIDEGSVQLTGNQTIAGIKTFSSNIVGNITGNSATATKLQTARTINGVAFDGSANITVSDSTAVKLTGDQTIAGTKTFSSTIDGSINGNAASATKLATARTINGVAFDGSANITVVDSTKAPLANPVFTGGITENVYNLTGTAITPANGTIQYKTVSANTIFTETLTAGQSVVLRLVNASSYTITFPAMTWVGNTAPVLTANCVIVLWKEQSELYGAYVGSLV